MQKRTQANMLSFQHGFRILDSMLRFEITAPQRPKLGQISKYLSHLQKLGEGWVKCRSQNKVQLMSLKLEILDFRHIAPFQPQCIKVPGVKNRAKI